MTTRHLLLPGLLLILCCQGCTGTSLLKLPAQVLPGARRHHQPARLLCLWEEAQGQGLDERTARGFAGQIMFFNGAEATPVKVHGTVRIYQYDDFDPEDLNPKPIHVFVFDDKGWNAHRAESTLGESYNVFLPYVKRHRDRAFCALKVEFIPEKGRPISSPITEVTLESRKSRPRNQSVTARNFVRRERDNPIPAVKQAAARADNQRPDRLDSLTIRLPNATER